MQGDANEEDLDKNGDPKMEEEFDRHFDMPTTSKFLPRQRANPSATALATTATASAACRRRGGGGRGPPPPSRTPNPRRSKEEEDRHAAAEEEDRHAAARRRRRTTPPPPQPCTAAVREGDSGGNPQEGKKKRTARRPRRDRRPQVLANVTDAVTVVSESGLPMEPSWVAKGYGMQLGCIVRETMPILTQDLRSKENEAIAQSLLQKLHQRYTFLEPFNKKVDSLALTKMSTALSSWKNRLKRKIEAGESWERISSKDRRSP
ncbi:hypothetical protein QYE76_050792 [Lolium multiflorum]|uniref:Uncharacterized protein n=1 Tax=Lolium multiflorum TaxID=4521 RepID=A0AAD8WJJ7_LOLMU|nr:hypothetical protein QYE76_050792 [Lolium multiflorum]